MGVTYTTDLETICRFINSTNKNQEVTNTIIPEPPWKEIKTKIENILKEYKPQISNNSYKTIIDRLNTNLNNVKSKDNNERLKDAFRFLTIELTSEDEKVILNRNSLFHGDFQPILNDRILNYRIHLLIAKLLLKYIGYEGYILNIHRYMLEDLYQSNENFKEDYFIKL